MLNKKETHINNKETYIKVENVESPETCWRQIEFLLKNILNQNEYLNFEKGFNVKLIDDAFIKGFINIQEQRLCHKIRMDGNKNRHIQGSNIKYNSEEYMSIRELIKKLTNIISVQKTGTRIN
jgi:hypothetical protein